MYPWSERSLLIGLCGCIMSKIKYDDDPNTTVRVNLGVRYRFAVHVLLRVLFRHNKQRLKVYLFRLWEIECRY